MIHSHSSSSDYLREILASSDRRPFVFLDTAKIDCDNKKSLLFEDVSSVLTFNPEDSASVFFKQAEDFLRKGFWLAGYFTYEFGYWLEPALSPLKKRQNAPLAWLVACRSPKIIPQTKNLPFLGRQSTLPYEIKNVRPSTHREEYGAQLKKIKRYLEEGLSYQVNYTFKIKFDFKGDPLDLYCNLRGAQPTSYSAFVNTGGSYILSLSPELFFRVEKNRIISRPMKGTVGRGRTLTEDKENMRRLSRDKKSRAENVMIVDLLRNDLGRISNKVWVDKLFKVERYHTLNQMTSTICGRLKKTVGLEEIFSAIFPCGSVTGAPKIKTMQIISELEKSPRGIYTGAIGYISPQKEACFNVAIRTIFLEQECAELGVGGGVLYDSIEKAEYQEAMLKAKFFLEGLPRFSLIESILWDKEYFLLDLHLKRLRDSCSYFSIPLNTARIRKALNTMKIENVKTKVRITVDMQGNFRIEKEPLLPITTPVKVKVSNERINPNDYFLFHKTTHRPVYDREREKAQAEGFFEVIFLNNNNEFTEGSISNIFILKEGSLYTPPYQCGLLKGVLREHLLRNKKVTERALYLSDIAAAEKIYVGNSVRGLLEAEIPLVDSEELRRINQDNGAYHEAVKR